MNTRSARENCRRAGSACNRWALPLGPLLALTIYCAAPQTAQGAIDVANHGGPTMQSPAKLFLVYWTPAGVALDISGANGIGNFENITQRFVNDLSGSEYLNITTQYPGQCGSNQCVLANGPLAVSLGGTFVDTTPYPNGRGTRANPLWDADVQTELQAIIAKNHWTVDSNSEFFVITGVFKATGAGVVECMPWGGCTEPGGYCAYHDSFALNGNTVLYGYLSDANFNTAGCGEGLHVAPNGESATDREIAMMSNELFETITDPLLNAWYGNTGEIGDNCNQMGINVTMHGNPYWVQQQWSNIFSRCVSGLEYSIQLVIGTGDDDIRGESVATASLQDTNANTFASFFAKTGFEPGWNPGTTHIAVSDFDQARLATLGSVGITLASHDLLFQSDDKWNIQTVSIRILSPGGSPLCTQNLSGAPLAILTSSVPTAFFDTPNCRPVTTAAEVVECSVFDDDYANITNPVDAVFINGTQQACIPNGLPDGTCQKWFGRCATVQTHVPVDFSLFDDGYTDVVTSDAQAIFINGSHQACVPNGEPGGTCRRWFGRPEARDGRTGSCLVMGDGYTNQSNPTDAVFINGTNQACAPDGSVTGTCQKWWGRCSVH